MIFLYGNHNLLQHRWTRDHQLIENPQIQAKNIAILVAPETERNCGHRHLMLVRREDLLVRLGLPQLVWVCGTLERH